MQEPYLLLQVKKGKHKDIKWPAKGDMVSQRKNRKESKRICQRSVQKASQLVIQAILAPSRVSRSEGFLSSYFVARPQRSGNEEGYAKS